MKIFADIVHSNSDSVTFLFTVNVLAALSSKHNLLDICVNTCQILSELSCTEMLNNETSDMLHNSMRCFFIEHEHM